MHSPPRPKKSICTDELYYLTVAKNAAVQDAFVLDGAQHCRRDFLVPKPFDVIRLEASGLPKKMKNRYNNKKKNHSFSNKYNEMSLLGSTKRKVAVTVNEIETDTQTQTQTQPQKRTKSNSELLEEEEIRNNNINNNNSMNNRQQGTDIVVNFENLVENWASGANLVSPSPGKSVDSPVHKYKELRRSTNSSSRSTRSSSPKEYYPFRNLKKSFTNLDIDDNFSIINQQGDDDDLEPSPPQEQKEKSNSDDTTESRQTEGKQLKAFLAHTTTNDEEFTNTTFKKLHLESITKGFKMHENAMNDQSTALKINVTSGRGDEITPEFIGNEDRNTTLNKSHVYSFARDIETRKDVMNDQVVAVTSLEHNFESKKGKSPLEFTDKQEEESGPILHDDCSLIRSQEHDKQVKFASSYSTKMDFIKNPFIKAQHFFHSFIVSNVNNPFQNSKSQSVHTIQRRQEKNSLSTHSSLEIIKNNKNFNYINPSPHKHKDSMNNTLNTMSSCMEGRSIQDQNKILPNHEERKSVKGIDYHDEQIKNVVGTNLTTSYCSGKDTLKKSHTTKDPYFYQGYRVRDIFIPEPVIKQQFSNMESLKWKKYPADYKHFISQKKCDKPDSCQKSKFSIKTHATSSHGIQSLQELLIKPTKEDVIFPRVARDKYSLRHSLYQSQLNQQIRSRAHTVSDEALRFVSSQIVRKTKANGGRFFIKSARLLEEMEDGRAEEEVLNEVRDLGSKLDRKNVPCIETHSPDNEHSHGNFRKSIDVIFIKGRPPPELKGNAYYHSYVSDILGNHSDYLKLKSSRKNEIATSIYQKFTSIDRKFFLTNNNMCNHEEAITRIMRTLFVAANKKRKNPLIKGRK